MKNVILLISLIFAYKAIAIGSSDRTIRAENITSDKSNQDISIQPTGTGNVILKDYTGFLKSVSGTVSAQALIDLTSDVTGVLPNANGGVPQDGSEGEVLTWVGGTQTWQASSSASTIQDVYDNSVSGEIVLDGTRQSFEIQDNSTPIGTDLFEITSNAKATTYLDVTSSGLGLNGGARVTVILDEDDMVSDSATALATQQSIKAYVDATSGAATTPTIQTFTSGSGTYTTPAGVVYIQVIMIGGGGGGSASNSGSPQNGASGGNTTFGTGLLSAGGGVGGVVNGAGGAGGTSSLGVGPIGIALTGGAGGSSTQVAQNAGGVGGASAFGGNGSSGGGGASAGFAGAANTGGGGGGGGSVAYASGSGGGAGGYVNAIIDAPAASYSYSVGAGGAGGTGTYAGGAGGSGIIIVKEYY